MPPKSAKKEQNSQWLACDKCGVKVIQNKLKQHENSCDTFGVFNESYKTASITPLLPTEIDIKEAPAIYMQRFIFVPETICSLCHFTMGCNLLLQSNGKKHVKSCWAISDKHLDEVYSTSDDLRVATGNDPISISRLTKGIRLTSKIELESLEELQEVKDVERLVRAKLKGTIVHPGNSIVVDFLGKKIKFAVKVLLAVPEVDIAEDFAQIQLDDDQFYSIDERTSVKIVDGSVDGMKDEEPRFTLNQIGGLDGVINDLKRSMDLALGILKSDSSMKKSRAVLVHGLAGSGKSLLCQALAGSYPMAHKIRIDSWKVFSKFFGESEANLKKHFDDAFRMFPTPTIIVIDEIANICPKNDSSGAARRVSMMLTSLLDSLHVKRDGSKVFVIANTSNLDNVDLAVRRSGRLDYEVEIPVPDAKMRGLILEKMLAVHQVTEGDIREIAKHTHGFVGADLENLIAKSMKLDGTCSNILANLSLVKPSAMRELLVEKPNVRWSDIGGMGDLKLKLRQIVEWPTVHPETFHRLGIKAPRGLLMFGPPGCSKTMIAKALATETNLNFISIKGSDLFSMWVGESEKAVRDLFVKARQLSPCIIFFDEIDAIGGERSAESGSSVKERVLAQILTEIDGVQVLKNVIIVAATNRPDLIDRALMRPGRLDRIVYVKLPDVETRAEIFKIKLAKIPIAGDVNIEELVRRTDGYSGAEIEAVCKEAALKALEDSFEVEHIDMKFFNTALEIVHPRTSKELLQLYSEYEKRK